MRGSLKEREILDLFVTSQDSNIVRRERCGSGEVQLLVALARLNVPTTR